MLYQFVLFQYLRYSSSYHCVDVELWLIIVDTAGSLFAATTVPAADRLCWTTFAAMVRRQTSQVVNMMAGGVTTADTARTSLSRVQQV